MAIDFGITTNGFKADPLGALRMYGLAQQDAEQQRQRALAEQKLAQEKQRRQQIAGAYNPKTGKVNNQEIERILLTSGDIDGYREYHKSLSGGDAEAAKLIGQLALQADTPEKWDASIDYLVSHGAGELAQYRGQFSEQNRMAALAAGGLYDDYMQTQEPKYIPVGENGVVNVRDHAALAAVASAQARSSAPQPSARQGAQPDAAGLRRQADEAIAKGADPAAVNARLQSMLGGAGSGPHTFP